VGEIILGLPAANIYLTTIREIFQVSYNSWAAL
jgi:hypothetical protein